ncbi:hypothetical protein [Bradyrhizobium sp. NC92]|uniref:hypothetical protein n=1 Tax=Bradyrhizobium sp. (strain NC92) TaxID=55395 RepID=UPI0021AA4DDD|nr:hypothetical protein [Bradyrhizobium sp. NC92]UWU69383.1 hypothetical protein N2602_02280 [Bradyrhizobium sp. NC92]
MTKPPRPPTIEPAGLTCMTVSEPPPNQLLQLLDAADFDLLCPYLATVEMVSKSVVGEVGIAPGHVYFPHGGSVSIRVSLSEGQTIEIAMLGRDGVVGTGAALVDGISPMDAVMLFPGLGGVTGARCEPCMPTCTQRRRIARAGQLVSIANISRREDDGTYPHTTSSARCEFEGAWERGGSLGNDDASIQRFPVRIVGGRL